LNPAIRAARIMRIVYHDGCELSLQYTWDEFSKEYIKHLLWSQYVSFKLNKGDSYLYPPSIRHSWKYAFNLQGGVPRGVTKCGVTVFTK